ncbi:MAG: bifunctional precorrin-2 dehydrogenase/sirohydrochlorin ferrochelatase [Bacteroidales bacterium]|jgi:siroheme synthase-like protein|nr:bifunctional precorrin-2 dehydrogenase/sirohydrochlorin ferrochelatase [Bacteroidales bacterium]
MQNEELNFLPVAINIAGKKIVIIGGGKVGFHKASLLSRFTDRACIISPEFHEGFDELPFIRIRKNYDKDDLQGAFLVYICTENEALNARIKRDAESLGILASVCDNPRLCDFVSPAIHREGNISIAVSSNAENVRRSIRVRDQIRELLKATSPLNPPQGGLEDSLWT